MKEWGDLMTGAEFNEMVTQPLETKPSNPKDLMSAEVRIIDPDTGGQKGSKMARFDLIPPEALWELAEHYGMGCEKYTERNWEKGYKWGLSVAALLRHLYQWIGGESYDSDSGKHHLIAVAWHAFALFTYEIRGLGTDNVRIKKEIV